MNSTLSVNAPATKTSQQPTPVGENYAQIPNSELSAKQIKLKNACEQFEAIFLRYLLKTMRESVPKSSLLPMTQAQSTYQDMFDGALATDISKTGKLGLGAMLYKQLSMSMAREKSLAELLKSASSSQQTKGNPAHTPQPGAVK